MGCVGWSKMNWDEVQLNQIIQYCSECQVHRFRTSGLLYLLKLQEQ